MKLTAAFRFDSVEKGSLYSKLIKSSNPSVEDIDSDLKDPQLCSLYAPEIYNTLRVAEVCVVDTIAFYFLRKRFYEFDGSTFVHTFI